MQAITVKFMSHNASGDARLRVDSQAPARYYPYHDSDKSYADKCIDAARDYAEQLGWYGEWHCGSLPNGEAVFVQADGEFSKGFEIQDPRRCTRVVLNSGGTLDDPDA